MSTNHKAVERSIERLAHRARPYFPHVGRFLLISTFAEDSFRIFTQWESQLRFMVQYRYLPRYAAAGFLAYCIVGMMAGSVLAFFRVRTSFACVLLSSVVAIQTVGYGLLDHIPFILRNISLLGAIMLLYFESMKASGSQELRNRGLVLPGLPTLDPVERGRYISLFGRIMLLFLFGSLITGYDAFSVRSFVLSVVAVAACLLIVVGYKAKYSAMLLICVLCVSNVVFNQWWSHDSGSSERDFKRYDFFQTLSIIGGFLILANEGPGGLSLEKEKTF